MKQQITRGQLDVVTKYFAPVSAGIETNILQTYRVLVRLGWDVTIHTSNADLRGHTNLPAQDKIDGIAVRRYPLGPWGFWPRLGYTTTRLVCLHNFNVWPHLGIYILSLWHRLLGRRHYGLFLTPHGGFTPEWPTFPLLSRLVKSAYHRTLGRWLINFATDQVRAVSTWEQDALIQAGVHPSKITLIENGLDPEALTNHAQVASAKVRRLAHTWSPYIVAVGRVAPIKNYATVIRALSAVPPPLNLMIIGPVEDQAHADSLRAEARELGVGERIHFAGVVRGADKYYLMKQAQTLVHLSRWESFCNVVYEAMSLGQLCLVADNTALSALVQVNVTGQTTPTFGATQLAALLKSLSTKSGRARTKQIKANLAKRSFPTWAATATLMDRHYRQLVQAYD